MAKYIGQIAGLYSPGDNLMSEINSETHYISKIGIQLPKDDYIIINGEYFQMGKTGKLEFENVHIKELSFVNFDSNKKIQRYVIIDYVYEEDKEQKEDINEIS